MQLYTFPTKAEWAAILARPQQDNSALNAVVQEVLEKVKTQGDAAVLAYEEQFDHAHLQSLVVSQSEIDEAEKLVSNELKQAILQAKANIERFHEAQRHTLPIIETAPGVHCWQKAVAIQKVGLYIPGGTAPLFSTVLMLAVPAKIAGCSEIVLCSPPDSNGRIHPAILYSASVAGVNTIIKAGGVQAIGAMAYGTQSVPKVYKIFGPGNPYVTTAKQMVSLKEVAIDMPAGPSEVAIMADDSARAEVVAADMLSQAEHGTTSQAMVFTNSPTLAKQIMEEAQKQCDASPRKQFVAQSLQNSRILVLKDSNEMLNACNEYAPEHLIIMCKDYAELSQKVVNAGSVFLGYNTPESAGDYASGTNHTLPTSGYAKAYSGVNLDSFVKKITFQEISEQGLRGLGPTIKIMAENEQLMAHKQAVVIRETANN